MKDLDRMSMLARYCTTYLTGVLLAGFLVVCGPLHFGYAAVETGNPAGEAGQQASPSPQGEQEDDFAYVLEDRSDPFRPFIEDKVATKLDPDEIVDADVELTGMQLFEPGQLRLVAILFAGDRKIAFVEDVTGKGYALKEGMLIGRYGVVSRIARDRVVVTETAQTRAGKDIVTTTVMRLNKEGDQ